MTLYLDFDRPSFWTTKQTVKNQFAKYSDTHQGKTIRLFDFWTRKANKRLDDIATGMPDEEETTTSKLRLK